LRVNGSIAAIAIASLMIASCRKFARPVSEFQPDAILTLEGSFDCVSSDPILALRRGRRPST
jgi:hypothetical protein